jgi:uncharacterized protein
MNDPVLAPAVADTHISTVAFIGQRAYKLLKPVRNDFLDYSTTDARLEAIRAELELNRRLSPDVYLGTADVEEDGRVVDRILVMRRLPAERRLAELVRRPGWHEPVRQVARLVASFHSSLAPLDNVEDIAGRNAIQRNWDDNAATMHPFIGSVLPREEAEHVIGLAHRYLAGREHLFGRRLAEGFVREGHGDLTAEDIFQLDDGPRILDCLAFDRRLRVGDVLADIAFLAMDLERLAGPAPADQLLRYYAEYTNEHHPSSLGHHYVAYRAHVRAKVACLSHAQGHDGAVGLARAYHRLCQGHLEQAAVRLVLIGGGPGTGKTTLANHLSDELHWPTLNTDEIRKDLTGHAHEERLTAQLDEGIYTPDLTERTYRALLADASTLLLAGESVILDASWSSESHRQLARDLASQAAAELVEVRCAAPAEVARHRIAERLSGRSGPSDATPELVEAAMARRAPWPSAAVVDTTEETAQAVDHLLGLIQRAVTAPSRIT